METNKLPSERRSSREFQRSPLFVAACVFLGSVIGAAGLIWEMETRLILLERARVAILTANYSHTIQSNIERALSASFALAAMVRQGNGKIDNFDAVAGAMLPLYPGLSGLFLAPAGVVRQVVPLAENEKSIGHDLLKDPARTKEAFLARETGKLTLAGPFNLVQGGLGAAGRLPVFLDGADQKPTFWGFSAVLIRFPDVLESTHLTDLVTQGMSYELFRINPDTGKKQIIAASSSSPTPLIDPVLHALEVPNASWTLSVAPTGGWSNPFGLVIPCAMALLFALLMGSLAKMWVEAHQRESQLRESEERNRSLLAVSPDGIWIHNKGTIHYVNDALVRMLGYGSKTDLIGKTIYELFVPEFREDLRERVAKVISTLGQAPLTETAMLRHDSTRVEVETSAAAFRQGDVVWNVSIIRDITERKKMEGQIHQLAFYDPLTKLPNRRLLDDRLRQTMAASKRSGCYGALMFLDLDNFKPLNDRHGHVVGDLLLIEAADRLKTCVRETDTVARFGGDEFVVMLSELDVDKAESTAQTGIIAEKIRNKLSETYLLTILDKEGTKTCIEHQCTASIGVTLFINNEASQDDILKWADTAMYKAKEQGRNTIRFYDAQMSATA